MRRDAQASAALAALGRIRAAVALSVALAVLSILDLVSTEVSMAHGAVELNPLMAPLLGTPWAVAVKAGLPLVVVALAMRVRSTAIVPYLRVAVAAYLAVVLFTTTQLVVVVGVG